MATPKLVRKKIIHPNWALTWLVIKIFCAVGKNKAIIRFNFNVTHSSNYYLCEIVDFSTNAEQRISITELLTHFTIILLVS